MRLLNLIILFFLCIPFDFLAQNSNILLGKSYFSSFEQDIYFNYNSHSSFKPLINHSLNYNIDSVLEQKDRLNIYQNKYFRKLFTEDLFVLKGQDYRLTISPILNLSYGKELVDNKRVYTNTRGYIIKGDLGKSISFFSTFSENQSVFSNYLNDYILKNNIVPGQGYARDFKEEGFDYAMSSGYVSFSPSKSFVMQFGHGKHFIGDGYRSLLLSDNSFNYPFLRIQTTFGIFQYTNLYAEFQDIRYFEYNNINNNDQFGYAKKYMSSHYLSINITRKLNISFFESIIWRANHAPGENGFDFQYLNPAALLRPIEFSINSPDNALVGLNFNYKFTSNSFLYFQFVLDEFTLEKLKNEPDYWANKYGYQIGYKHYNLGVKNLTSQIEYNYVRPYTYAHHNPAQNYAHYNQPLAHPLGANFSEFIFIAKYMLNKWEFNGKLIFIKYGAKKLNDPTSYGNDLYMSTGNYAEENQLSNIGSGRPSDFGIYMYQGNETNVIYQSLDLSYIVNRKMNLKCNLQISFRSSKDEYFNQNTHLVSFGIKTDLFNHYYDF